MLYDKKMGSLKDKILADSEKQEEQLKKKIKVGANKKIKEKKDVKQNKK